MAFYVEKEEELYKDGEKENRKKVHTLAERLIAKMDAYMERLKEMPPEEAKKEATECLKKSGILLENGELNEVMFQPSKYISSEMFDSMREDAQNGSVTEENADEFVRGVRRERKQN